MAMETSLLHWVSFIVWRKQEQHQVVPVELVCLQVALECLKLEVIPPEQSFVQMIANDQEKVNFKAESGKKLKLSRWQKTGFFIIPDFVSMEGDLATELKHRVMQCKKRRTVFQGSVTMTIVAFRPPLRRCERKSH